MRNKTAFTLIELLVVVAIISLLVSILIPSLTKAKELAKSGVCATNQRSLAIAFHTYANDNDGRLVPLNLEPPGNAANGLWYTNTLVDQGYASFQNAGSWDGSNGRPYGNFSPLPDTGIWQCPSVALDQRLIGAGYGINEEHMQWYAGSVRLDQLYHASDRLMIADSCIQWTQNVFLCHFVINSPAAWDYFYGDCRWDNPRSLATRHLDRGNIAFADSHIESWVYNDAYQNKNNLFACDEDGDGKSDW